MYRKVLVPLDGSELAECVLPHVEALAKGGVVKEIVLVRAVEPFHLRGGEAHFTEEQRDKIDSVARSDAKDYLDRVAGRAKLGVTVHTEVLYGKVADSLVDYARNRNIDLIIIATHGRSGISRMVRGSIADHILSSACVPVLMVRAPGCVPGH